MAREMKDSGVEWIGCIPKSWSVNKIKHNFSIVSGATPKSENSDYWDGEIHWITPADYKTQDRFVCQGRRNLSQEGYESCGTTLIPTGSIVFSKRAPVGSVAVTTGMLCTNQGCLSCIPYDKTDSVFYYYAMSVFTEQFELMSSGTTFKEISADAFADFYLPHPTLDEQHRIASFLDIQCSHIDAVIEKTRTSIEEYKKLKQAVITQAVTKGIRGDRPMKDSGAEWIGEIPNDWIATKVKYVASSVTDGAHVSPETEEGVYDFISTVNIDGNRIDFSNCLKTSVASYNYLVSTGCKPYVGDVLISKDGTVGKTVIVNQEHDFVVASSLVIIRPKQEMIYPEYLNYFLKSKIVQDTLLLLMHGAGLKRVSVAKNANLPLLLPSRKEQHEIIDYLDQKCRDMDLLIENKEHFLTELETYKKSLIYEYVTGKKEVPAS